MSWSDPGCNCPEIHFAKEPSRSAYDGPAHAAYVIVASEPDGHELLRAADGAYYSRRLVARADGTAGGDAHGRWMVTRRVGETDRQLVDRWRGEVERGWYGR